MSSTFLGVKIYKTLVSPIKFGKIIFKSDSFIQIAISGEGGGGGFSPLTTFSILIKSGTDYSKSLSFIEKKLTIEETPITSFVQENLGVLFEEVNI